jgi:hypothetical protein
LGVWTPPVESARPAFEKRGHGAKQAGLAGGARQPGGGRHAVDHEAEVGRGVEVGDQQVDGSVLVLFTLEVGRGQKDAARQFPR